MTSTLPTKPSSLAPAAEVTPIREVDNRQIGASRRGPVTEKLQQAFFDLVNGRNPKYQHWLTPV